MTLLNVSPGRGALGTPCGVIQMSVELGEDEVFSAAVAGLPKVAELIATFPSRIEGKQWRQPSGAISKLLGDWATRKEMLCNGRLR